MAKNGLTLIEVLVIIVIVVFLAALLLPTTTSGIGCDFKGIRCVSKLKNFYAALLCYYTDSKSFPVNLTGENLWLEFGKSSTNYLLDEKSGEKPTKMGDCRGNAIYQCPFLKSHYVSGDYTGPKAGWEVIFNQYNKPSIKRVFLGADRKGNHYDGKLNALRKDGGIVSVSEADYDKTDEGHLGGDTEAISDK